MTYSYIGFIAVHDKLQCICIIPVLVVSSLCPHASKHGKVLEIKLTGFPTRVSQFMCHMFYLLLYLLLVNAGEKITHVHVSLIMLQD